MPPAGIRKKSELCSWLKDGAGPCLNNETLCVLSSKHLAIPPSYALAMLCHPGLAIAKTIASCDHHYHGCARGLDIPTLMVATSRLLSQPP